MHFSSYLCEIYIHMISVLFVCSQEFSSHHNQHNHQNPYNRRILRPNSERSPNHAFPQQNAMFAGRAHPRPNTIGFEDTTQRPPESRLPSRESTSHVRQQMPYQTNDPHKRSTNSRQQLISHMSPKRQDSNEMPFHLPPKFIQNSNQFHSRPKYPQIVENQRHLRIQSPHEREEEYDDVLQNVQQNNLRNSRNNQRGMGSHNFGFNGNNNNNNNNNGDNSRQQFSPSINQPRSFEPIGRPNSFFPSPAAGQVAMKVVMPRHRDKEETRVHGFETFETKHNLQEFDKIYPETERPSSQFHSYNDLPEESEDYGNVPENEARLQRDLNLFPPVEAREEIRRFNEPFNRPPPKIQHSNREEIPDYYANQFKKTIPNSYYSEPNQQNNQNKANHQNNENFEQHIEHTPPHNPSFNPINGGLNGQTFFEDSNPNAFDFRRNNVNNKPNNRFQQQFYGNDFQRQTTQKPHQIHNTYGRPVKKEIAIVREITEILPSDDEQSNNNEEHFDPSPIATPSPPDPPNDFFPFIEDRSEGKRKQRTALNIGKDENFYDDDEERQSLERKNKDIDNDEEEKEEPEKRPNPQSKFEKEVDMSADELEKYFDKEFTNENSADEDGQKKIEFDDEPKESNQMVAEKKPEDTEDADVEADYKSSTDFLKNHDDFLTKIERENDKFRKRTEDKVEKEEDDETETEQKPVVDETEKELDGVDNEKKEGEEVSDDKDKSDQNTIKEDKGVTEEEQAIDGNEETKDKKETEAEDDEESETKEVTEKQDQKNSDNTEDNQQNEEKNEEQEEDNGTKDEEKSDNTENDESIESNDEKETKTDKCLESNCDNNSDKELLKEESKESKNTQQLKTTKERQTTGEQVIEQKPSKQSSSVSIETKPIESKPKPNTSLRILSKHNFAPFFIDLKRINPNKSNTGIVSQNNERTTSATTSSPPTKQRNSSAKGVSPPLESSDANKTKPSDNNKTIENRRVVNSIKDIIKSQNHR